MPIIRPPIGESSFCGEHKSRQHVKCRLIPNHTLNFITIHPIAKGVCTCEREDVRNLSEMRCFPSRPRSTHQRIDPAVSELQQAKLLL